MITESQKNLLFGLLIFSILTAIYTITYSGIPRIEDEQIIAARAQSFVLRDEFSFPQLYGNDRIRHLSTVLPEQADFDVAVEPGQSFLAALLYRFSLSIEAGGTQAAMTTNIYLTSFTGVVVFLTIVSMHCRPRTAVVGALIFGLGTMAWPYSKTIFRDDLLMFFVSIVFLGFSLSNPGSRKKIMAGYVLMTFGFIGGVLAKRTAWILVPALGFALFFFLKPAVMSKNKRTRLLTAAVVGTLALVILVISIPSEGTFARYSLPHFAFALQRMISGIGEATPLALLGPFLSPGKSIFLFSPILLLAPIGLVLGWRQYKRVYSFAFWTIVMLVIAQALFYREAWAGIPIWGLRFMLPAIPPMILFCAPIIDRIFRPEERHLRWAVLGLLGLSILIQISGTVVKWTVPLLEWHRRGWDPYTYLSVWDFTNSPIPIHLTAIFDASNFDMAWFRTLPSEPRVLSIPILAGIVAGSSMIFLYWILQRRTGSSKHLLLAITLSAIALVLPLYPSLHFYRHDPVVGGDRPEFEVMLSWVESQLQPGDFVVVDSYGTPMWQFMINRWRSSVTWFSLPYDIPRTIDASLNFEEAPSQAFHDLIEGNKHTYNRVWYILTDDAPGYALQCELRYLDTHFPIDKSVRITGRTIIEVRSYSIDG